MITISPERLPQATRTMLDEAELITGLNKSILCTQLIIWLSDRLKITKRELSLSLSTEELNKLKTYAATIPINSETDAAQEISQKAARDKQQILKKYAETLSEFAILLLKLNSKQSVEKAISATKYAKKHRCSRQYICKQIAEGKIKATQKIRGGKKIWQITEER